MYLDGHAKWSKTVFKGDPTKKADLENYNNWIFPPGDAGGIDSKGPWSPNGRD